MDAVNRSGRLIEKEVKKLFAFKKIGLGKGCAIHFGRPKKLSHLQAVFSRPIVP